MRLSRNPVEQGMIQHKKRYLQIHLQVRFMCRIETVNSPKFSVVALTCSNDQREWL